MRGTIVLTLLVAGLSFVHPQSTLSVIGVTTIEQYPYVVSLSRFTYFGNYSKACTGVILTKKSVLTAAQCVFGDSPSNWRIRTGSTWANRNGTVYSINEIIVHPGYNARTYDSDIAILKTSLPIAFSSTVSVATIPSYTYIVPDNQTVTAVGWGPISYTDPKSEQLRHVQGWTVNQQTCVNRYSALRYPVTDNMICSGVLSAGSRDQCIGDIGGPLVYNNVVIGIYSWSYQCVSSSYPGVNTRISKFTPWIQANA